MTAIYSNGVNRWNVLGFSCTKRDALSSLYKISMDWRGIYRFELSETAVYSFRASNNNYILFDINSLRTLIIHVFYIDFMDKDSFVNIKSFAN